MSCYHWELEAILKGLMLKQVDEREKLAEMAINLRYTMNAKKIQVNKLFNKKKEEQNVLDQFKRKNIDGTKNKLAQKVQQVNGYFKNRFKSKESENSEEE